MKPSYTEGMYCETCIATVQELRKAVREHSGALRQAKIKAEMRKVCESLTTHDEKSLVGMRAACKHMLDVYGDKFEEVFLMEKEDTLEAHLCYLYTKVCTGVKRKTFQDQKQNFDDKIIEEFVKKHGDRVRRSKPTANSESLQITKEEL
ncbi:hypothetical protein GDO81_021610 [Engystomops pustulosus]|uniref:Saposin B-type domain-containing protein n=1 Tax=Engystomops pustulosus TaxID=76066 RepID=A0AAV6Z5Q3_ENGPU|nr:hypothetical protein GDO81_021610 [Engystomops pustulosus]